jgi:hypothetical protein
LKTYVLQQGGNLAGVTNLGGSPTKNRSGARPERMANEGSNFFPYLFPDLENRAATLQTLKEKITFAGEEKPK